VALECTAHEDAEGGILNQRRKALRPLSFVGDVVGFVEDKDVAVLPELVSVLPFGIHPNGLVSGYVPGVSSGRVSLVLCHADEMVVWEQALNGRVVGENILSLTGKIRARYDPADFIGKQGDKLTSGNDRKPTLPCARRDGRIDVTDRSACFDALNNVKHILLVAAQLHES
jgi:hypothetical protein